MSNNMFRRTMVGAVAVAGALGLAACNNDTASVSTPSGGMPTATSQAPTATEAPSTSSEAPTTEESTTTSSTTTEESSPSESSSTSEAAGSTDTSKVTTDGTQLKFGETAVFDDESDGKYKLKIKSISAAPKAAYAAANLNESNGKIYYVKFDVTNLGGSKYGFRATSPSRVYLKPVIESSEKVSVGGNPYDNLPGGCNKSSYDEIAVGKSASACYYYQVTGDAPTKVMWDNYDLKIIWSK